MGLAYSMDLRQRVFDYISAGRSVLDPPGLGPGRYIETQRSPGSLADPSEFLDNLATHKSLKSAALLKRQQCWFLYLPACSPDLNPIEMAFAKLKAHLRRIEARTCDTLIQAPGNICDLFSPNECWNYFKAAGSASC